MLDAEFLKRLERVSIVARKSLKGIGQGERRGKRAGGSVEFSDYRRYSPGDDTRRVDWYAYARLEQMFLKLFVEEQDLALHLLVDLSGSMETGEPTKRLQALQVAAALGYVALAAGDRVSLWLLREGAAQRAFAPLRGRHAMPRLLTALNDAGPASGATALGAAVRSFLARRPGRGVVVLLSDLLDPAGIQGPLERLRYAGFELHVLHVIAPEERSPEIGAEVELTDIETQQTLAISLDQRAIRAYKAAFEGFLQETRELCMRHGISYVPASSSDPLDELVLGALRRSSLVR
ncbi:MAG: DUF58 domain-containing protein [Planctomycetes bacterium]|nr:DUF58 domain-containing protein [Planctomycetota bacterium]